MVPRCICHVRTGLVCISVSFWSTPSKSIHPTLEAAAQVTAKPVPTADLAGLRRSPTGAVRRSHTPPDLAWHRCWYSTRGHAHCLSRGLPCGSERRPESACASYKKPRPILHANRNAKLSVGVFCRGCRRPRRKPNHEAARGCVRCDRAGKRVNH